MVDSLLKASPLRAGERDPQLSAWKVLSANFAVTEFCEVRCCAQSMQKDFLPSWISGRILQGRGRKEVMGVRRHPLWCMPDQPITGRGMKEIVTAWS
jgi:hypothetical protein